MLFEKLFVLSALVLSLNVVAGDSCSCPSSEIGLGCTIVCSGSQKAVCLCGDFVIPTCYCRAGTRQHQTEEWGECSSSNWCYFNEHCVNGQCVPKDVFNRCFSSFDCAITDECVDGVCRPR